MNNMKKQQQHNRCERSANAGNLGQFNANDENLPFELANENNQIFNLDEEHDNN